jgi:hypothetical protein
MLLVEIFLHSSISTNGGGGSGTWSSFFTMLTARFLVDGEKSFLFVDYNRTKRRRRHAEEPTSSIVSLQFPPLRIIRYNNANAVAGAWNLILEESLAGDLWSIVLVTALLIAYIHHPRTYSPCTSQSGHDTTRDHGGPQAPRALENHA